MNNIDEKEAGLLKPDSSVKIGNLIAKTYNSGFVQAHDTYNALSAASDGKIYYILSSDKIEFAGKMYVYDPKSDQTELLADLNEVCGEKGKMFIPQGKSHTRFYESQGKLYFSTHIGYYELIKGMDRLPVNPPADFKLYPGGHIISYDLKTKEFNDLAILLNGEGMVTMTMDCVRGQVYGITWPKGNFVHYNVKTKVLKNLLSILLGLVLFPERYKCFT